MQTDVLIVGGGFTGLALAAALKGSRLDVTLLDAKPPPPAPSSLDASKRSPAVIAVSPANQAFLESLGAWQLLPAAHASAYKQMHVADGSGTGAIKFSAAEEGLPVLGHIVDRLSLTAALAQLVKVVQGQTRTLWGSNWTQIEKVSEGYRLQLNGGNEATGIDEITTRLLVGADGAASAVREAAGLQTWGRHYSQQALVCLARLEQSHQQTACQWFTESGPLAFLPLASGKAGSSAGQGDREPENLVAVVWSTTQAEHSLSDKALAARLTEASERLMGEVIEVSQRAEFPLAHRQATRYSKEGVVILGDAAHTIHPLAGQGANLGFADARCLATELRQAHLEGRSPGDMQILKRYESARRKQNLAAGAVMEGFHHLFLSTDPLVKLLRNRGLALAQQFPRLKSLFVALSNHA